MHIREYMTTNVVTVGKSELPPSKLGGILRPFEHT